MMIPIAVKTKPTAKATMPDICSGSSEMFVGNPNATNRHMHRIKSMTPMAISIKPGKVELFFDNFVESESFALLFLRASILYTD